jgi:hypothetical protein
MASTPARVLSRRSVTADYADDTDERCIAIL